MHECIKMVLLAFVFYNNEVNQSSNLMVRILNMYYNNVTKINENCTD